MSRPFALASALAFALTAAGPSVALAAGAPFPLAGLAPVNAKELQQRVDARLAETRALLEQRLAQKNVPEARAIELRARFEAASAKVAAEVTRVAADGVVTQDDAREVRAAAHLVRAELRHALRGRHADRVDYGARTPAAHAAS